MATDTAKATVTLRDLTAKFDNSVRGATPFYPRVCTIFPSTGLNEKYAFLGNMPGIREWLGDRQFKEVRGANFVLENKHWESSLLVKKTDIDDDRLGLYGPLMDQLAIEAAYHPDELTMETLIVGGAATTCWDGQYFFDTDHAFGDSGSQSNDLTFAAATGTTPTAAEFKDAYHQARTAMLKFKNDQGKFLNRPVLASQKSLMLLVPPELEQVAKEALTATLSGGGNTNIILDSPEIVPSPHLTDAAVFYLFNLGGSLRPFVFQAREPLSRGMKGMDDLETKDVKFMTEARYNVGYLAWWAGVLTTFT